MIRSLSYLAISVKSCSIVPKGVSSMTGSKSTSLSVEGIQKMTCKSQKSKVLKKVLHLLRKDHLLMLSQPVVSTVP